MIRIFWKNLQSSGSFVAWKDMVKGSVSTYKKGVQFTSSRGEHYIELLSGSKQVREGLVLLFVRIMDAINQGKPVINTKHPDNTTKAETSNGTLPINVRSPTAIPPPTPTAASLLNMGVVCGSVRWSSDDCAVGEPQWNTFAFKIPW